MPTLTCPHCYHISILPDPETLTEHQVCYGLHTTTCHYCDAPLFSSPSMNTSPDHQDRLTRSDLIIAIGMCLVIFSPVWITPVITIIARIFK